MSRTRSGRRRDARDPAEELIRTAESADAEFIVIGLRRRSPVGKLLLGSNAQRVLLDACCPVLAVKGGAGPLSDPDARLLLQHQGGLEVRARIRGGAPIDIRWALPALSFAW